MLIYKLYYMDKRFSNNLFPPMKNIHRLKTYRPIVDGNEYLLTVQDKQDMVDGFWLFFFSSIPQKHDRVRCAFYLLEPSRHLFSGC